MLHRKVGLLIAVVGLTAACTGGSDGKDEGWDATTSPDVAEVDTSETDTADGASPDSSDDDSDTTDGRDANDTGVDVGMDTGDTDGEDTGSGDTEPDADPACERDTDADGLVDCEEEELCTDPNDGDTDGDHLGDFEEYQHQTDPCQKDTDNDGATDKEEIDYGYDPNKPNEDLWVLSACDSPQAEPVDFHENATGNWTLALPPAFDNYTELQITGASSPVAAALYDDPATEVAGALLSKEAAAGRTSPTEPLRDEIQNALTTVGSVVQDQTGGEFDTHDKKAAAVGHYLVQLDDTRSVRRVRQQLLMELAPFSKSDATGFPNTAGAPYGEFRISVSVIHRDRTSGPDQSLIALGIAPESKFSTLDKVQFRVDDLTNTTNIAEQVDGHTVKCTTFTPPDESARAEFYWVLDQSGSMDDDNQKVAGFSEQFEQKVSNTPLDYRMGVTNMDKDNRGRLRVPPAWHRDPDVFQTEVQEAVIGCQLGGSWACSNGAEHGLEAARRGIKYMTGNAPTQPTAPERIRTGAEIITIFMSDEDANTIRFDNSDDFDAKMKPYIDFFTGRTTAYSIVGTEDCGTHDGRAYKEVALETGGKYASLCAEDLGQTIQDIIIAAVGRASNFVLPQTPISSSLRVFINGRWVPRSRRDGFEYFEENNSIAFFGKFRPTPAGEDEQGPGDFVAVSYETFRDRCKHERGSCSP